MGKDKELKSRFAGAMIGSALGDAIGEIAFGIPEQDALLAHVAGASELRYTDDTAMAIALAESLTEVGDVEAGHLGRSFHTHFKHEPWRGYGPGPPAIFAMAEQSGLDYSEAARQLYGGQGSLGNGAAMRIAPLGLYYFDSAALYDKAAKSAAVTHAHKVGMDGAAIQAKAVALAVQSDAIRPLDVQGFVRQLQAFCRTDEMAAKLQTAGRLLAADAGPDEAIRELGSSIAAHESMPFALYSFLAHPDSFEGCLLCAVLHGGDRDTMGAMACAMSGARLGDEAIPAVWRDRLENRQQIEALAALLLRLPRRH